MKQRVALLESKLKKNVGNDENNDKVTLNSLPRALINDSFIKNHFTGQGR